MAKFHGYLLKDCTLSLFNNANIIFSLVSQFDSKMPLVNFFLDTHYFSSFCLMRFPSSHGDPMVTVGFIPAIHAIRFYHNNQRHSA